MNNFLTLVISDFKQRIRNPSFIVIFITIAMLTAIMVPRPEQNYTTLSVVGFKGNYTSQWVGYITSLMGSVLVFVFGFFFTCDSLNRDYKVGIVAFLRVSPLSQFKYLFYKYLSNFLILITIHALIISVTLVAFCLRSSSGNIDVRDFIFPFSILLIPGAMITSAFSLLFDIWIPNKFLKYCLFLLLFSFLYTRSAIVNTVDDSVGIDVFGIKTIGESISKQIEQRFNVKIQVISIGYTHLEEGQFKSFNWDAPRWSASFYFNRALWVLATAGLVYLSSFRKFRQFKPLKFKNNDTQTDINISSIRVKRKFSSLPPVSISNNRLVIFYTEFFRILQNINKYWLFSIIILWFAMWFMRVDVGHHFLLPFAWLMLASAISDAPYRNSEKKNKYIYLVHNSFNRVMLCQLFATFSILLIVAFPILFKTISLNESLKVLQLVQACFFLTFFSYGITYICKTKKIFEIVFFLITYAISQKVTGLDYLGIFTQNNNIRNLLMWSTLSCLSLFVIFIIHFIRKKDWCKND